MQNSVACLTFNSQRHACVTLYEELMQLKQNAAALSAFCRTLKTIRQK